MYDRELSYYWPRGVQNERRNCVLADVAELVTHHSVVVLGDIMKLIK